MAVFGFSAQSVLYWGDGTEAELLMNNCMTKDNAPEEEAKDTGTSARLDQLTDRSGRRL